MHKTYLDIDLPEISLYKRDPDIPIEEPDGIPNPEEEILNGSYASRDDLGYYDRTNLIGLIKSTEPYNEKRRGAYKLDLAKLYYNIVIRNYTDIQRAAYLAAVEQHEAINVNTVQAMKNAITTIYGNSNPLYILLFETLISDATTNQLEVYDEGGPYKSNLININTVQNAFTSTDEDLFLQVLTITLNKFIETQEYFYQRLNGATKDRADEENSLIKFAWINKIGHFIFESVEILIGGHTIDKHYGDWLNIWHELAHSQNLDKVYDKMIGDVEILTSFDRELKPKYNLRIPLQFWFCKYSGLSIPLVSLEYHEVTFLVKFRKMEELSYIEEDENIFVPRFSSGIFLDEVPKELNIDICANLAIDYIYLDSQERRRFAQSSHEYLIEQLQILSIPNIEQHEIQCLLNNFNHPTLEMIWYAQRRSLTENFNGSTKLEWDNYTYNGDKIIINASIDFHSHKRVQKLPNEYFNYVQPWQNHTRTPSDGVNIYSFSLHPEESQPSGSANFTRLSRIALHIEFNGEINEALNLKIFTRSYNILRFISGMARTAYTSGN
jgi:hypothetical protein